MDLRRCSIKYRHEYPGINKKLQKFPKNSCIVVASGVLGALNIRESNDIDLVISHQLYGQPKKTLEEVDKGSYKVLINSPFEARLSWDSINEKVNLKILLDDALYIDDVPFVDLCKPEPQNWFNL